MNKMEISLSSKLWIYGSYCLTNSATTIFPILQDNHHPNNRPWLSFYHPLMQTEIMFIGEMLCLFAYLIFKGEKKPQKEQDGDEGKPGALILIILIPMMMDMVATTLVMMAFNFLSGSVYSITSSSVIIFTAIFSKIMLKTVFNRAQLLGCLFAIIGVVITGLAEYLNEGSGSEQNNLLLGLMLTLAAHVIEGLEVVVVEIIFRTYDITPNQFVGISGTAGTIICGGIITGLTFAGCPLEPSSCTMDYDGNYHLVHVPSFFRDLSNDAFLITMLILNTFIIARYNYDVNRVIIVGNAMIFQVVSIFSNVFVWIIGIIITLIGRPNDEYIIESLDYKVMLIKVVGFVMATIGLLLYNQVIFKGEKQDEKSALLEDPQSAM